MTSFQSVSTAAARFQDISLNPQKLAGQCAKLKCCLNFEVDSYVEASRKLPPRDARLETADATYFYFKADIFRHEITYSTDKNIPANLVTIDAARAFEVIALNKAGEKPLKLKEDDGEEKKPSEYADILGQDSLTRFDSRKKRRKKPAKKAEGQKADAPKTEGAKPDGGKPDGSKQRQGKKPQQPKQQQGQPKQQQPRPQKQQKQQQGQPKQQQPRPQKPQQPKQQGQPKQQQPPKQPQQ